MPRAAACAWVVAGVGAMSVWAAAPAAQPRATARQAFAAAAGWEGATYAVARDALASQGKAALDMLTKETRSADWRRRALAEALILRITRPDKVAVWTRLWWWKHQLTFRDDGTVVVAFDPGEAAYQAKRGIKLPAVDTVVLDRQAVPFILDTLRESARGGSSSGYRWQTGRMFLLLRHFADPHSADALIHFGEKVYQQDPTPGEALVKIGKAAVPALCRAAGEVSDDWHVARRQALAADVLARIGGRGAAPTLVAALGRLRWPDTIVAYCRSIARLDGADAAEVLFGQLVAGARGWAGQGVNFNTSPVPYERYYTPIREALISLGPGAAAALEKHAAPGGDLLPRAIAAGVLAEIRHGKGADQAATGRNIEWTVALRHGPGAVALAALKQNAAAFEAVAWFVLDDNAPRRRGADQVGQVVTALAEAGHPRAVELYAAMLAKKPASHTATIVEALLIANQPKGAAVLKGIISREGATPDCSTDPYRAAAALARAVLPALEGRPGHLAALLKSEAPAIRVTAARHLARAGDLRALDVLVTAALGEKGAAHARYRDAVVAMGKPVVAPLNARREKAADWREKLFCEAAALRVTRPKLAAAMHAAGLVRDRGFMMHAGPTVDTFRGAGRRVAAAVGAEAVPLLEAAVAWHGDSVRAGIAVFALEQFKQARSIGVLAADFNAPGWAQGGNLVAAALVAFGPAGVEAARKVPPADPAKARFASRVSRHRAATSTLAAVKDDRGVEGVLAGLELALADKIRSDRAAAYLRLAAAYDDPRLIEATIKVLDKFGRNVCGPALAVLVRHKDERIVPACLKVLSWPNAWSSDITGAFRCLARVKGKQLVPFLIEQLGGHADAAVRAGIARTLGSFLSAPDACAAPGQPKGSDAERAARVSQLLEALRRRLADAGRPVQIAAAGTLAACANKRGLKQYVQPLLAWTAAHRVPVDGVMDYLVWSGDAGVGAVLLACYRQDPQARAHVGRRLARFGHTEAIGDIAAALETRIAKGAPYSIPEIGVLCDLGKPGRDALFRVFKARPDVRFRVPAAAELCSRGYREAFDEAHKLFDLLLAGGPEKTLPGVKYADERRRRYESFVMSLAHGMVALDRNRGYPIVSAALLTTGDESLRGQFAWCLQRLRDFYPDVAKLPVTLAP